jgi:signal transduction histidine kinase
MLQTESEIIIFIILSGVLAVLFIAGTVFFLLQFQKKKIRYEKDKQLLHQQHQQALLSSQLEVQAQTMQDIGRDIHDNVGQKLTLASLYAQQLDNLNEYPQIKDRMGSIVTIINESLAELRSLSKNLTSTHIAETPLKELLRHECDKVSATGRYTVNTTMKETGLLSVTVKTIVLRIVQEFFQNSLKHAGGSKLQLQLKKNAEGLSLLLKDDGKGFATGETASDTGIGLQNMRQRAEIIGARLILQSAPGQGTQLELIIPENKLNQ